MLRALIFDFDGLLVDTETVLIDAWVRIHAEDGVACRREHLHGTVGRVDYEHDFWAAYPAETDRAALDARYLATARRLTLAAPPLPGAAELLARARSRGLRVGLASNSSHAHVEGHLAHRGLLGQFDFIACREDVETGKPAPDVYLAALRGLGVTAEAALAFEDSVPGHEAAHRAELPVVVVPNPSTAHCEFPHARLRLGSLAEVDLDRFSVFATNVR